MKTIKNFIFIILLFLTSNLIFSQYGNGYGNNGYGNGGYSNNRMNSMNAGPQGNRGFGTETSKPKDPQVDIDKTVEKLKTDLKLDELQVFAIKKVITESSTSQISILKKEVSQDEKVTEVLALADKTDSSINSYLSKDQKEKYKVFIEERKIRMEKFKESNGRR